MGLARADAEIPSSLASHFLQGDCLSYLPASALNVTDGES